MSDLMFKKITMCLLMMSFAYSVTESQFDENSSRTYLIRVTSECGYEAVSEVLNENKYVLQSYVESFPLGYREHMKTKLNNFTKKTSPTIEGYLKQQADLTQQDMPEVVDADWERQFQTTARSHLLLPQAFKNPVVINKYLAFLRSKDPACEQWLHRALFVYEVPLSTEVMNVENNYRVYEAMRSYYRAGGGPLSELLAEKVKDDKKKREAEAAKWHFSDVFSWFSSRASSSAASSVASSSDQNGRLRDSFSSQGSNSSGSRTPPKNEEQQALLGAGAAKIKMA